MGFTGQTYQIPCDKGGLSANPNVDLAPPQTMLSPSRNLNLNEGGRRKRGGTAKINSTAVSGGPTILGVYDYTLKAGTQYIMLGTSDGKVYKNFVDTVKTGLTANKYPSFETFNNVLFFCNGYDAPWKWNGTTQSALTGVPTDWSGTNYPVQFIKHGYGNSERMWAIGCLGSATTGYRVYASADGNADDFSDANVITIEINTADAGGIVAGVEYGDRLFVFSKRHAFIIDDTDSLTSNWSYYAAIWNGGAAHHRVIVKTPTDIVIMAEDGDIYSLIAAQNYGDYKIASLIRSSFIDKWIRENVDLTKISQFHGVYDPVLRAVKYFVVRSGQTTINTALVYFIDRDPSEAWMIHDNQFFASGYSAASSALIKYAAGDYRVYTGGYSGFLWSTERADRNDDNNGYYAGFKTPPLSLENPRISKRFPNGRLITTPKGNWDLQINWWVDGNIQNGTTVALDPQGGVLGSFVLDTDVLGGNEVVDTRFELGQEGKRIQLEVFNSAANQDFFISNVLIDFVPIGAKP